MSHNHNVQLIVRNQPSNGRDGFTNTTATNNAIYSYMYTGGDDDHGDIRETLGTGSATINVGLSGGPGYRIDDISFRNDTNHELSWSGSGSSAAIIDANSAVQDATYCTSVTDTQAQCSFDCDPMIGTDPRPPMRGNA